MPVDFIKVNTTDSAAFMAKDVQRAAKLTEDLIQLLTFIKERSTHLFVGAPTNNFAPLEQAFGVEAGKGQTVFDMINGTLGAMAGTMTNSQALEFKNRVG